MAELRGEFPDLGCVIQSSCGGAVRLRGAGPPGLTGAALQGRVPAPEGVAFPSRREVDRSYARCLRVLLGGRGYPMLATHDPRLISIAAARAALAQRAAGSFEYQMLYGIRPSRAAAAGRYRAAVRVYVPYGNDWYGYLVRRLAERPANLVFFLRSLASRR